jgi:DNA-binding CsgD family transcriptional regulator
MPRKDPLPILEAAYSFEPNERLWMQSILDAARPYDLGMGMAAYIAKLGPELGFRSCVTNCDLQPEELDAMTRLTPDWFFRACHLPRPFTWNDRTVRSVAHGQVFDVLAVRKRIEDELGYALQRAYIGNGGDAQTQTFILCLRSDHERSVARPTSAALDSVIAHLGAALRLRSALGRPPTGDDRTTEAILSPTGKVLDARGKAAQGSLTELVDAAKRTERARSRKASPEERCALWTALFEGQWSIVESCERDGTRMLLACRNEPRAAPIRKLSARERSVVEYAALGHPLKYVAYELGLSEPAVSSTLRAALRKLGLASRAALIRAFGPGMKGES